MIAGESLLTDFLAETSWTTPSARTEVLARGVAIELPRGQFTLVYVAEGVLSARDAVTHAPLTPSAPVPQLRTGDFFFVGPTAHTSLRADADARAIVVQIIPAIGVDVGVLPETLTVHDFASREPAVAGLVSSMGCNHTVRESDAVVCSRIATVVMSAAIRSWVDAGCAPQHWLLQAHDRHIAEVLTEVQADPGRAWSVASLARIAAMSRSSFAKQFRDAMGTAPLAYVASVRLQRASAHLRDGADTIAEVAARWGYTSEDGFSRAFRRHTGQTPSAWRASHRTASPVG